MILECNATEGGSECWSCRSQLMRDASTDGIRRSIRFTKIPTSPNFNIATSIQFSGGHHSFYAQHQRPHSLASVFKIIAWWTTDRHLIQIKSGKCLKFDLFVESYMYLYDLWLHPLVESALEIVTVASSQVHFHQSSFNVRNWTQNTLQSCNNSKIKRFGFHYMLCLL